MTWGDVAWVAAGAVAGACLCLVVLCALVAGARSDRR